MLESIYNQRVDANSGMPKCRVCYHYYLIFLHPICVDCAFTGYSHFEHIPSSCPAMQYLRSHGFHVDQIAGANDFSICL